MNKLPKLTIYTRPKRKDRLHSLYIRSGKALPPPYHTKKEGRNISIARDLYDPALTDAERDYNALSMERARELVQKIEIAYLQQAREQSVDSQREREDYLASQLMLADINVNSAIKCVIEIINRFTFENELDIQNCFSSRQHIAKLRDHIRELDIKDTSKTTYLASLKTIIGALFTLGEIETNHTDIIKARRIIQCIEPLTDEDIKNLLATKDKGTIRMRVVRNACFFSLYTGLRVSDLCEIKWTDLLQSGGSTLLKKIQKKTKKEVRFILNDGALSILKIMRELGKTDGIQETDQIFPKEYIQKRTSYNILKEWKEESNCTSPCTFHSFRHSFAHLLQKNGTPVELIKELLGHSSLASTDVYLKRFMPEQMEAANNKMNDLLQKQGYMNSQILNHPC